MTKKSININKLIGKRLKIAREHRGYSQSEFGSKVNFTQSSLSNIERGHRVLTIENLIRFSKELNVNPLYFLCDFDVKGVKKQ
jgi:transcriptional regulator with XRE-family HTH domain